MKVVIRDSETLSAVKPFHLTTYLHSIGWREAEKIGTKASIWTANKGFNEKFEILVPLDVELGDYATRIAEVLNTLELYTDRTQLQIISDINGISLDVVRVRAPGADDGTVALRSGIELFNHSYAMLMAAASSAVVARPVYFSNKSQEALNYIDNVRLGQTERGSFILTLLSPVPISANKIGNADKQEGEAVEPFERRVTRVLAASLQRVNDVSSSVMAGSDYSDFQKVVDDGVSSNLCEALIGMAKSVTSTSIDISFSWSPRYVAPQDVATRVIVARNMIPTLEKAAELLKKDVEPDNVEIQGFVVKLARPRPKARGGEIVISGIAEGVPRKALVKLSHEDYQRAVTAHEKYKSVVCYGQLVRQGNAYRLKNPYNFAFTDFFDAGTKRTSTTASPKTESNQKALF